MYKKLLNAISKGIKNVLFENQSKNFFNKTVKYKIPLNNDKNIIDVKYIFDDFDKIPFKEKEEQYKIPIEFFTSCAAYGHNIMFINENKIICEHTTKTFNPEYVISEMQSIFHLADWQVKSMINKNCKVEVMYLIANLYNNAELLIKAMETYGWSFSNIKEIVIDNQKWAMLNFDPMFQESVNLEIRNNPILFHWTPEYNYENIIKNGLEPRSENYKYTYPPKVHLSYGDMDKKSLILLGKNLCVYNINPKNDGKYVLLNVDTTKLDKDIEFFYDPRFEKGYYTKQTINPIAISKNFDYDFKNDK